MRRNLYFLLSLFLFTSCSKKKQNFVFILVDDLGWTDLGYSGSTFYETPNIDTLSDHSVKFTNAYASCSVCSPSRASIMTGMNPARVNITDWIPGDDPQNEKLLGPDDLNQLPLENITIAEVLKTDGYETFFAGKWHLGGEGFLPDNQGFDHNLGGHHMGQPPGGYYSPYKNPKLEDGPDGEYLTDRLTNESIDFLSQVDDDPFFLYLNYYTVHTPIQACKRHLKKFEDKLEGYENKVSRQRKEGDGKTSLDQLNPAYASMIYALDENIGRLIKKLKEEGLYENTTIIFTSDNGGLTTLNSKYKSIGPTSVLPLRAGKGWLYEGGIRVPLLIKPANYNNEKRVSTEPVIGHDFYPTMISMADLKTDENIIIDGVDLSGLLDNNTALKRDAIFWHYPHYHGSAWKPGAAIRQGDWKLIEFYESNTFELYNLADDISETNNLASTYPIKSKQLLDKLHNLQKSVNASKAIPNPKFILK
jgi:arylsulfatase A-like enzyme